MAILILSYVTLPPVNHLGHHEPNVSRCFTDKYNNSV